MIDCFVVNSSKKGVPIYVIKQSNYNSWLKTQPSYVKSWLKSIDFPNKNNSYSLIPGDNLKLEKIIFCIPDKDNSFSIGVLPLVLPVANYYFAETDLPLEDLSIAWGLGSYKFQKYKTDNTKFAKLILAKQLDKQAITNIVSAIYIVRDLINTPAEDMGPSELAVFAKNFAKQFKAKIKIISGNDLLKHNYPMIHAVGKASDDDPKLIDIRWGDTKKPKITLVGKGVCFDSGGLDIKTSSGMLLMKKDMGGAAHVLGLAHMIMSAKLPVYLRVLIPVVENSVSGSSYKPGDILQSRKGLTVEIGNTDAEGRLVLADAITEACNDNPDLIIDIATLTGAARVALGTELPAVFSNDTEIVRNIAEFSHKSADPVWHMPLFTPYKESLQSLIADINNVGADSYGGAITAALFLQEFLTKDIPWVHYDLMAWNLKSKPAKPQGGEAMGIRGLFNYLSCKYI